MAPSTRGNRVAKRQAPLRAFIKVTKSTQPQLSAKARACERLITPLVEVPQPHKKLPKRKRPVVEDDDEPEAENLCPGTASGKKAKLFQQSSSTSQKSEEDAIDVDISTPLKFAGLSLTGKCSGHASNQPELPPVLQDLKSLHRSFLKAFTIHVAHNGPTAPADLASFLGTITRIWKKDTVSREDIQRMLAIYEIGSEPDVTSQTLRFKNSPFKLNLAGLGNNVRYHLEFCGSQVLGQHSYEEQKLQDLYETELEKSFTGQQGKANSWLSDDISLLPRLEIQMGVQTQVRREKASLARSHILGTHASNKTVSTVQTATQNIEKPEAETVTSSEALKARTLSLFDRVKAKQLANSSKTAPTTESILRSRAIGRVDDVVDILRMKQQQKLGATLGSSLYENPSQARSKISFGMNQVIHDIRSSLSVPIAEEEIHMCIKILANDVPGTWLTTFSVGKVQTVILDGSGMSGFETKRILSGK
ncbi:hypothetical protein LTR84_011837 [Exophiala bonariae]|uniref:DNA replication factor Cdt1 C-terminal domain-containing protein n=1 Tax=Exophiala bonariae TaxID=1690606 RepID=A0AAV9NHI8_9EURO|nr:hypothetical protein LTR84_011837 [Exophiala bonariae]